VHRRIVTSASLASVSPPRRPALSRARRFRELITHLAYRELSANHRFTLLGAGWPLSRLLAQWFVLAFVFGRVVDLGIEDYPTFLLCGLIAWSWFAAGVPAGTESVAARPHLVLQPGLPALVLPAVAVAVTFADVLVALPVLIVLVIATNGLDWSIVFLPVLLIIQFTLMCGVTWLTSAAAVYLRDVRNLVGVAITLLFYVTPVFYDLRRVPENLRQLLELNPLTPLVDG
jgi:lipopolysaccharide transport system permease protein